MSMPHWALMSQKHVPWGGGARGQVCKGGDPGFGEPRGAVRPSLEAGPEHPGALGQNWGGADDTQGEGRGMEVMPRDTGRSVGQTWQASPRSAWSTVERLCCWAGASIEAAPVGVERLCLGGQASNIGCAGGGGC